MILTKFPKRLKEYKDWYSITSKSVNLLVFKLYVNNPFYYFKNKEIRLEDTQKDVYSLSEYKYQPDLNFVLDKPSGTWSLKIVSLNFIDFDCKNVIGIYLFNLFEEFIQTRNKFRQLKQKRKVKPDCLITTSRYDLAKRNFLEIRKLLNHHSNVNYQFEEIKDYCLYLINLGVKVSDFKKIDTSLM